MVIEVSMVIEGEEPLAFPHLKARAVVALSKKPLPRTDSLRLDAIPSDARSPGGRAALDVLLLKDEKGELCDDPARWEAVREDLSRAYRRLVQTLA